MERHLRPARTALTPGHLVTKSLPTAPEPVLRVSITGFDVALAAHMLCHVPNIATAVKELRRVVRHTPRALVTGGRPPLRQREAFSGRGVCVATRAFVVGDPLANHEGCVPSSLDAHSRSRPQITGSRLPGESTGTLSNSKDSQVAAWRSVVHPFPDSLGDGVKKRLANFRFEPTVYRG
jgi:SAM-dependent methyltransferase